MFSNKILKRIIVISFFYLNVIQVYPQTWLPLNAGVNGEVRVLFSDSSTSKLFVGGSFTEVNNIPIHSIASWNGSSWDSLGGGMEPFGSVISITRFQNDLFAGGFMQYAFSNGNRKVVNGLGKWNNSFWDSIPQGFHPIGIPYQFIERNGILFMVGSIDSVGVFRSPYAVAFDGNNWIPIGIPNVEINQTRSATSCVFIDSVLYIGGSFSDSTYSVSNFASLENSSWVNHCVSSGCGDYDALAVYNGEIYLSGINFVGPAQHIMKFDGSNYSPLNGDLDWRALKLKVIHNKLFAVGGFDNAGGQPASKIAIWDGQVWSAFSNDIFDNNINDIAIFNDELYVAGGFTHINGVPINGIAKYSIPVSRMDSFIRDFYFTYTNPVKNLLNLSCNKLIEKLTIVNSIGIKMYSKEHIGAFDSFDVSFLSPGLYLLILETKEGVVVRKIIKQ